MPRPPGRRNHDHDATREALLARLRAHLAGDAGLGASFRELARVAGVTEPTLRHYFGDRVGVLRAVLAREGLQGRPFMEQLVDAPLTPLARSVRASLEFMRVGWSYGAGGGHIVGLREGLGDPALGPAYLSGVLEPSLDAFERRLARHADAGHLRPGVDLRVAALALAGPVLLALLHQHDLDGVAVRPLAWDAFLDEHVRAWVAGYGAA